jgi:large subunit ribosomal protein L10
LPTPRKAQIVAQIEQWLRGSQIVVVTDYRGLTVAELNRLRNNLRGAQVEFHVTKNTLARLAARNAGVTALERFLEGPTAIAFGLGDPVEAAKAIVEAQRQPKPVAIKGAVLDGRVLTAEDLVQLSRLPAREVLLAQVVGAMQAPIVALVSVLSGPVRSLLYVLQARSEQIKSTA